MTIQDVTESEIPLTRPSPHSKQWWTKKLTDLQKRLNILTRQLYHMCDLQEQPIHQEYKTATNLFKETINSTRSNHWFDWLENISAKDIYIANKYLTSEPSDFSKSCIPALKIARDDVKTIVVANNQKAKILAETFFPPLPTHELFPPGSQYPTPLETTPYLTRKHILQTILKLKPFKAPGSDGILNVVYKKCSNILIDHLYYIYRAIREHNVFHQHWLVTLILVIRKPGKPRYNTPSAHRPIGLCNIISKLHSTATAKDIIYIAKSNDMLPAGQFGGHPGRNTSDAMHIISQKIKGAWCKGDVAAAVFLNIKSAFPNMVPTRLIHNMKMKRVPTIYINLIERMLTERWTILKFDDYALEQIQVNNGVTQGFPYQCFSSPFIMCLSSMLPQDHPNCLSVL